MNQNLGKSSGLRSGATIALSNGGFSTGLSMRRTSPVRALRAGVGPRTA
jgi:hypothetical protein